MQSNCIDEGVLRTSLLGDHSIARLGVLYNNEPNCESNDSAIGLGLFHEFYGCEVTAGWCNGSSRTGVFAWLFVR
jgi:hypothetical protein